MINESKHTVTLPICDYNELKKIKESEMKPFIKHSYGKTYYGNVDNFNTDIQEQLQTYADLVVRLNAELNDIKSKWWYKLFSKK